MLGKKAKTAKRSRKPGRGTTAKVSRAWTRPVMYLTIAAVIAAGTAVGMSALEGRVLTGKVGQPPLEMRVVLAARPEWMPESLAHRLAASLLPSGAQYYDRQLIGKVHAAAAASAWVSEVLRVEKYRTDDPRVAAVELDATFRMPVAKIRIPGGLAYVDAAGVRLPAEGVAHWSVRGADDQQPNVYYLSSEELPRGGRVARVHYVMIEGVVAGPPAVGRRWPGDDMAAGLRLAGLVATRPYAYEVTTIDVANFGGRVDPEAPHLGMTAQTGRSKPTDIRFGRFPAPGGDYVVSPARKLSYLDSYVADHTGRLAGWSRYIDLRYDELHFSIN